MLSVCKIDDCDRTKIMGRGMCSKHYTKWSRQQHQADQDKQYVRPYAETTIVVLGRDETLTFCIPSDKFEVIFSAVEAAVFKLGYVKHMMKYVWNPAGDGMNYVFNDVSGSTTPLFKFYLANK